MNAKRDSHYSLRDLTSLGADIARLKTEASVSRFIHVEETKRDLERLKTSVESLRKELEVREFFSRLYASLMRS